LILEGLFEWESLCCFAARYGVFEPDLCEFFFS